MGPALNAALWHGPLGSPAPPAKGAAQGSQGRDLQGASCPSPRGFSRELLSSARLTPKGPSARRRPRAPPPQSRARPGDRPLLREHHTVTPGPGLALPRSLIAAGSPRPGYGAEGGVSRHGGPRRPASCSFTAAGASACRSGTLSGRTARRRAGRRRRWR